MVIVLELRCPKSVDGISIDPDPNWNFNNLVSELEFVERKLNNFSEFHKPIRNTSSQMGRSGRGFVMRVSEDEMESEDEEEKGHNQTCTAGKRFACDELYLSDESVDEFDRESECLVNKMDQYEVINEHKTETKDDIRNQVIVVEMEVMNEIEMSRSAIGRVEKYSETRKEVEVKLDFQYQRKVAEALVTYLTKIQREHEIKMQMEERKIKSEEEARRRDRAHQEEKIRQENKNINGERNTRKRLISS